MVGSALVRHLENEGCTILAADRATLDLTDAKAVDAWVKQTAPQAVFVAAAKVGGIVANDSYPADFLLDNLAIETAIFRAAHVNKIEKLLFLGSSCIYPRLAPQPITKRPCLRGRSKPPTNGMPSPRSRASSSAGVPAPVWQRFHFRHADQSLWPRR